MTEAENWNWIYKIRLNRAAQLKLAMLLSECGVRVLREAATTQTENLTEDAK